MYGSSMTKKLINTDKIILNGIVNWAPYGWWQETVAISGGSVLRFAQTVFSWFVLGGKAVKFMRWLGHSAEQAITKNRSAFRQTLGGGGGGSHTQIFTGILILGAGAISHNWPLAASDRIISGKNRIIAQFGEKDQFCKMYSNSIIILTMYLIIFWKKYSSILKSNSSNMIFTWCKYCSADLRCILKVLWRFFSCFTTARLNAIFMAPVTFYDWGVLETN